MPSSMFQPVICMLLLHSIASCAYAQAPGPQQPQTGSKGSSNPGVVLQQEDSKGCPSQGLITAVWCREDSNGALQDIIYLNSASGLQSTGCSGRQGSDSSSYSKAMILEAGEAIVAVRACSMDRDGYTSVTFITDSDKQLTCGTSKARRQELNNGRGDSTTPSKASGASARSLLAGGKSINVNATAAAKPATWWWFDWGHDDNDDESEGGCQLFTPDEIPEWATASARSKTGERVQSFVQGGSGADAYLDFGRKRYYKNPATYQQQLAESKSNSSSSIKAVGLEPATFWDEVEPLAGVTLQCNGGLASSAQNLCWNSKYTPPPTPWGVSAQISLTFTEGFTCPKTPQQIQGLQAQLSRFSNQLAAGSGGVLRGIAWGSYSPTTCQVAGSSSSSVQAQLAGNVTITLQSTFLPAPGQIIFSLTRWLMYVAPQDLCDISSSSNGGQSACFDTDIDSAAKRLTTLFGEGVAREQQVQAVETLQDEHESAQALVKQQHQKKNM